MWTSNVALGPLCAMAHAQLDQKCFFAYYDYPLKQTEGRMQDLRLERQWRFTCQQARGPNGLKSA